MPPLTETPLETVERLRAKLRETEDMLVAAEELLLATGLSWEDVERNKAGGDTGQSSVQSAAGPYRLLVEQIEHPALTIMNNGSIVFCNNAFADLVGLPRERLVGAALSEFLSSNTSQTFLVAELVRGAKSKMQWSVRGPTGEKPVSLSCRSVSLFGKTVHSLVITPRDFASMNTRPHTNGDVDHGMEATGHTPVQQSDGQQ